MLKFQLLLNSNYKLGNVVHIFSHSVTILGLYHFSSITLASKTGNEIRQSAGHHCNTLGKWQSPMIFYFSDMFAGWLPVLTPGTYVH